MTQKEIPVFFAIDDAYAPFFATALSSLKEFASKTRNYRIIVLCEELREETVGRLKAFEEENFKIDFVRMTKGLESITNRSSNCMRCDTFTLTIYFRLFIPAMFPQYDKGIYLDSDIVLNSDVAELFDTELGENYIGACNDLSVIDVEPLCEYMENAVGVDRNNYINSGVLLLDLKKLREAKLDENFLYLLNKYHFESVAPDQDYINAMLKDKILYLSPSWDAMPNENLPPIENPKLVHYNLFSKPWCYDDIQYGDLFWKHATKSGYFDQIKKAADDFTDEQRAEDKDCLERLVRKAVLITNSEITFKKIYESGEKIRL